MVSSSVNTISTQTVRTVNTLPSDTSISSNVVNNTTTNSHMKNPPLNMGVIIPPDAHYKPIIYSDHRATKEFNQLNQDIYTSAQKSKNIREKKTPLSVKILAGIAAIAATILIFKK